MSSIDFYLFKICFLQYTDNPKHPSYIASQGPIGSCVGDFWQMVWEQGITDIIMLSMSDNIDVCLSFHVFKAKDNIDIKYF